jgi:galactokinase
VLGAAIDRCTVVVGRAIRKPAIRIYAESFGEFDELDLTVSQIDPGPEGSWVRYVRGVIWALRLQIPQDCGFEAVITGNVPLGAGLSSSASLQVALALFLNRVCGVAIHGTEERLQLAQRLRKAENGFVGVASGLLDFVTVLFGRPGHAVFLDCRTLEVKVVGLGENPPAIVIMDTCTSRKLADGMYNIRRSECERVVDYFRKRKSIAEVRSLRDTTAEELSQNWKMIDPVGRLRARHVLLENQRVADGVQALESGELEKLGELVSRSHRSSMSDFQNSSNALDSLVTAALRSPGCLGAKLSGAGWAGCVVALVRPEKVSEFTENCKNLYEKETGGNCKIYVAYSTGPSA